MTIAVSLYLFEYRSLAQHIFDGFAKRLDVAQQEKLANINPRKQHEFIISRTLLKYCLNHFLPKKDIQWKITEQSQLPPLVSPANQLNIQFNISHSASMIGIAVCESESTIGFDLQKIKTFDSIERAMQNAKYFCSNQELLLLEQLLHQANTISVDQLSVEITKLWTMKEAFFKQQLCGIHQHHLKHTHFQLCADNTMQGLFTDWQDNCQNLFQMAFFGPKKCAIQCFEITAENDELKLMANKLEHTVTWQGFKESSTLSL